MRPPKRRNPHWRDAGSGYSAKASGLQDENTTAIILPLRSGWHIAMQRAHQIRKYRGTAKVYAVKLWRVSVQDALEVRT